MPLLESLYRKRWGPQDGLGALVISPTRELVSSAHCSRLRLTPKSTLASPRFVAYVAHIAFPPPQAIQIFEVLRKIGPYHSFSAGLVIGGKNLKDEMDRLTRMNILIATPGRLLQHMDQTVGFECDNLQMLGTLPCLAPMSLLTLILAAHVADAHDVRICGFPAVYSPR